MTTTLTFLFLSLFSGIAYISPLSLIYFPPLECSQKGLACKVLIGNCSGEGSVAPSSETPGPPDVHAKITAREDDSGQFVPIIDLRWSQLPDGRIYSLNSTEVCVVEVTTNHRLCVCYILQEMPTWTKNPRNEMWAFSLDRIAVIPNLKYQLLVTNLPKPDTGSFTIVTNISVPERIWGKSVEWSVKQYHKQNQVKMRIEFEAESFFEQYRVSIYSPDLHPDRTRDVMKDGRMLVTVEFTLDVLQINHCHLELLIQPLSVHSMKNCVEYREKVDICPFLPDSPVAFISLIVLGSLTVILTAIACSVAVHQKKYLNREMLGNSTYNNKSDVKKNPVQQEQKKVIVIYSLDHHLYKEIILKLCAFLRAKCGTEVTLDLLESSYLSTIGRVQWLDLQRERISKSSHKVLILCSPGVQAKWKAMCGEHKVTLKEDERSPIGDMLTPALSLIVTDFVHASSFHKYLVAYFEEVCSEEDVPSPFNILVKYKLMKHFEELCFRILDVEKHEPGQIKSIEGIRENDFFRCPSGRALQEAIQAFKRFQMKNPNWFDLEILGTDEEHEKETTTDLFPTDRKYLAGCKVHTFVNMILTDEQALKSSVAETAVIPSQDYSVSTTDVSHSGPGLSSVITFAVQDLPTVNQEQHASSLQPLLVPLWTQKKNA